MTQVPTPTSLRFHGQGVRGIDLSRSSVLFEGRFGRIFRALPPAEFGTSDPKSEENLTQLATKIAADLDCPKDAADPEESGIPSLYTYLGQFIDHDLTFDPTSSLQRQNDPDALEDFRTPRFDLDCVYGRGPDDQPYMYTSDDTQRFLLGKALTGAGPSNAKARDLPRSTALQPDGSVDPKERRRAIIGDPRNDENVIVSQLQGLFLKFHNRLASENPSLSFTEVQRLFRFHYQWVVTTDFLKRIVTKPVLKKVLPHLYEENGNVRSHPPQLAFYHFRNDPFMPLEFSAAAYRFGHSMVRPGYRLNDGTSDPNTDTLLPIFPFLDPTNKCRSFPESLTGFREPLTPWAIDWARFIPLDPKLTCGDEDENNPANRNRLQLAYRIDTSVVNPLSTLPKFVASNPSSLPARNLLRGWRMRLASGQNVARAMGEPVLSDDHILIGKFVDSPDPNEKPKPILDAVVDGVGDAARRKELTDAFTGNCPLWVYILAETHHHQTPMPVPCGGGTKKISTPQLGPVGGRIVAEVFAGLLLGDRHSFWNQDPLWRPAAVATGGVFELKDFVSYAIGM
jgi:hypothetical protein